MNFEKLEQFYEDKTNKSHDFNVELDFDLSNVVIPFTQFINVVQVRDIESRNDEKPCKYQDPELKKILRQEFVNCCF
jgi:hypothetical protein